MKHLITFLSFLISCTILAKNYNVSNLTNNEGLSNSSINTIFQDSDGLLWFGTWDGLDSYNGRDFRIFKPDPSNSQTISNNIIREIVEGKRSSLWIATDRGINKFDKKKNRFERFFVDSENQGISGEHSFLIAKNSSDRIFAAVNEQGIFYYDEESNSFRRLNISGNYRFRKIFIDLDDNLWFYTESKTIYKVVFRKGNFKKPIIKNVVELRQLRNFESVFYNANNEILMQASNGKIFSYKISEGLLCDYKLKIDANVNAVACNGESRIFGTSEGLVNFDQRTGKTEHLKGGISVLSLLEGTQHIIWVGTDMQGVWQFSPSREKIMSYTYTNVPNFGNSAVRTFFEAPDRALWVGTKGSGIYIFTGGGENTARKLSNHLTTKNGLLSNSVFTITKGQQHEYWIGTDGRGINYYDTKARRIFALRPGKDLKQKINLSSIYSILPSEDNTLWVGTSGYGMYRLTIDRSTNPYTIKNFRQYIYRKGNPRSLSNNIVYSIIRDDVSHLWIATRGGGLNRFEIRSEEFQNYKFSYDNPGFISSDDILCLYKDRHGTLWAGTSMGLNKLIGIKKGRPVFKRFTEKDGIPNNTIHGILEDKSNTLWLSTNKGIANLVFEQEGSFRIIPYYSIDGLQNNEFSDGAFYESPNSSQLYFGGISGFNEFNPLEITHSSYIPRLMLDAFYIENVESNLYDYIQTRHKVETLILPHKYKSFSFKFIPLDYIYGSKCEISYMLEGYDKSWIHLGTSSTIVFSNLPSGKYTLKVHCSNANKIWSKEYFTLPVIILPPWWASKLAYICYTILLILIFMGIRRAIEYQITVKRDFRMKELDKQKTEEIHQAKLSFFTNIAHEFSNSLTLIYGPCEQLLKAHPADDYTRKYINIIRSNSERMQNLIQQLIEFRKAETGHLALCIEKIEIPELIKFVADNFTEILEEKKIRFNINFPSENIIWKTDRDSVEKLVFNLISNAVKYTPEEKDINVDVAVKDSLLHIKITNTGIGIKQAFQERIFDRFEVLDRFEMQVSKGYETRTGIGLALCKSIVDVLHGNIEVESDGKTYTSFVVSLPEQAIDKVSQSIEKEREHPSANLSVSINHEDDEEPSSSRPGPIPDSGKQGLVMVIDDDMGIRQLLKDILSEKYEVTEASNGKEAIEYMRIRMPVIIICDILMPEMDGVEFVKVMKGQEITRHIPIILLSTKGTVESQIEGLQIGADAYISKPFNPRHLDATINSLLYRNKTMMEYSDSIYASLEQYEGKMIHKEDKNLMLHITKIINDHMDNEALTLDFVANETALSKMQLYRKIKEITGQTPTEFFRSLRLKQAEKLLKTTNRTVQEIMYSCGFNNKAYFYREFARKYHLTPKEYRIQQ